MRILNSEDEFMVVRHSLLNGIGYSFEDAFSESLTLQNYVRSRKIVVCFEGDLHQIEETNEPVFTHRNSIKVDIATSLRFRKMGIIATLDEVIDSISLFKKKFSANRIVLCVELKQITRRDTIKKVMLKFKENNITEAYFDSFYGDKLDEVSEINEEIETNFEKSFHVFGSISNLIFSLAKPKHGYDVLTVPMITSFGKPDRQLIYGTVNSKNKLRKIAKLNNVIGAYIRFREGNPLFLLFNSVRNTERFRGKRIMKLYRKIKKQ